jgi:hypothetical protein
MIRPAALALVLAAAPAARGDAPLFTDAATIVERGTCSFETWHRWSEGGGHAGWGLPACSVHPLLELGAGFARARREDAGSHTLVLLRARTAFAADAAGRWSIGGRLDALRDGTREDGSDGIDEVSARALATLHLPDAGLRFHFNAGAARPRGEDTFAIWGVAGEVGFAYDWTLAGEIFRDQPGSPSWQVALRYLLVFDRVELFLSGGEERGRDRDGWFAIFGARFQSPPLF